MVRAAQDYADVIVPEDNGGARGTGAASAEDAGKYVMVRG